MKESDLTLDKLPPQNIEAEQSVLGAILLDNIGLSPEKIADTCRAAVSGRVAKLEAEKVVA